MRAGPLDGDALPVDVQLAAAAEHRPHRACTVGPAVGAGLVGRLGHDQRARLVLGMHRPERLARGPQELLDRELGLGVGALAVVVLGQVPVAVPQVARRPALVVVGAPQLEADVDAHRMFDLQARHRRAHGRLVLAGREARRVNGDHAQAVGGVALVPRLDVGEGAQRAGRTSPRTRPTPAARAVRPCAAARRWPRQACGEGRSGDVVDRRAHRAGTLADAKRPSIRAATLAHM